MRRGRVSSAVLGMVLLGVAALAGCEPAAPDPPPPAPPAPPAATTAPAAPLATSVARGRDERAVWSYVARPNADPAVIALLRRRLSQGDSAGVREAPRQTD